MKKKCFFEEKKIEHIDFRDTPLLEQFLSANGEVMPRKRTGVSSKNQRKLTQAVKRARIMSLLPFVKK